MCRNGKESSGQLRLGLFKDRKSAPSGGAALASQLTPDSLSVYCLLRSPSACSQSNLLPAKGRIQIPATPNLGLLVLAETLLRTCMGLLLAKQISPSPDNCKLE